MTQTILAWQAVGVGRSTPDLVARDGIYDKGLQPNLYWAKYHATTGVRVGGDLWESPDVWNRNAVISNPSTAPDIHEPPSQVAAGTQQNTFLSRLFNYSSCTSPAGTIQQYWTIASTGEMWPNDWINDTHGNCQVSRELNPIQVSAGAVPMGGSTTFGQVWTPPSPADLYACGVPPIDTQNGARYELCMLSRFVSATDTMYAKETADIAKNVIENNNVVTRNTFIAEVSGVTGISPIKYLMIKNNNQFSASLNIVLSGLSGTQQSTPLYVDFVLSPTLWQRWVNSGMQCQGVTVLAPRVLRATNLGLANISNIPFNSLESLPLGVQVTMPIATIGKVVSPYVFTIHHESSDARVKLLPSSVCKFETQVSKKTASEEVSTPILSEVYAAPNPMRTGTRVVFDVAMEGTVSIELFGVNGELVQSLGMGRLAAGRHTAHITLPDGAAAGVYFCRVATPSYTRTIRILKL
jgi:hypothetical protein